MDKESLQKFIDKIEYDKTQYQTVYDYIMVKLHGYIKYKFGGRFHKEDIEDFTYEVFKKLHDPEVKVDVDVIKEPIAYLYAVTYHHIIDQIRKLDRIDLIEDIDTYALSPSDLDTTLFKIDVQALFEKLDKVSANLVYMHCYLGYRCSELAQIFKLTHVNVRVKIHRAIKFITNYCNKHNIDLVL